MVDDIFPTPQRSVDLRRLPEFAPSAALWPRIETAHRARVHARRWYSGGLVAAAAAVVAAIALSPGSGPPAHADMIARQRESQALEHQWHQLAQMPASGAAVTTRLRTIDVALQSAYDHGAAANELASLWQQRNEALRDLIEQWRETGSHNVRLLTRI